MEVWWDGGIDFRPRTKEEMDIIAAELRKKSAEVHSLYDEMRQDAKFVTFQFFFSHPFKFFKKAKVVELKIKKIHDLCSSPTKGDEFPDAVLADTKKAITSDMGDEFPDAVLSPAKEAIPSDMGAEFVD